MLLELWKKLTSGQAVRALDQGEASNGFAALVAAGDRARDAREWSVAARCYRAAVSQRPSALGIAVQLGHALKESAQYAEAEACYRAFLAANPRDADIHLQFGHLFLRQRQAEEARRWYEQALQLAGPNDFVASEAETGIKHCANAPLLHARARALTLTDAKRFGEAYELLSNLVMDEGQEDLTGILGNVCKELGRFSEAQTNYERYESFAQANRPELLADVFTQQGHLLKIRREYMAAIGCFAKAKAALSSSRAVHGSAEDLEREIRLCLAQITTAIELR
jgi:tetratricopeptide (TPR) repeat protein